MSKMADTKLFLDGKEITQEKLQEEQNKNSIRIVESTEQNKDGEKHYKTLSKMYG